MKPSGGSLIQKPGSHEADLAEQEARKPGSSQRESKIKGSTPVTVVPRMLLAFWLLN
jgi:hypothetical protein